MTSIINTKLIRSLLAAGGGGVVGGGSGSWGVGSWGKGFRCEGRCVCGVGVGVGRSWGRGSLDRLDQKFSK